MAQGGYRAGKYSGRSKTKTANHGNMPSIPTTVTQQGRTSSIPSSVPTGQTLLPSSMPAVQASGQSSTPTIPETSPVTANHTPETSPVTANQSNPIGQGMSTQSNPICEGTSNQSNIIGEGDSSSSHARTLVFLTSAGLEPSIECSSFISNSFRSEVDPNGIS